MMLKKLFKDITGGTALEFVLIASIISIAALGAFKSVGETSKGNLESVESAYSGASSA